MSLSNAGVITLNDVRYTTCPEGKADWEIRADSVSINTAKGVGKARDARVEFFGIPLLRLPAISFPVGNARKTGLLFPSIGSSSRGGVQVSVPYYLNIAPQQDFTFTPTWYTSRGIDLEGDYRYLTRRGRHELLANFLPGDDKTGETRSRWRLTSATDLPTSWRLSFNGENVSDARYFEDFAQGADGASIAFLPRTAQLAYRDDHRSMPAYWCAISRRWTRTCRRPTARTPRHRVSTPERRLAAGRQAAAGLWRRPGSRAFPACRRGAGLAPRCLAARRPRLQRRGLLLPPHRRCSKPPPIACATPPPAPTSHAQPHIAAVERGHRPACSNATAAAAASGA